ncbi:MAG: GNAT family N-acetyltransferase [Bdellovibrio sp.]|nr:GNAT family N-acetyltransferase [Bdellovibrio sp.]
MIRFANAVDHTALSDVYQKIADAVLAPAVFNWNTEKALQELKVAKTLVYANLGIIVSFISFRESAEALEITALGTIPICRKQGYLEALLLQLTDIAAQHDKPLWLEVHELNSAARQLYQKWGFELVQNRKNYYPDGASTLVMTRSNV